MLAISSFVYRWGWRPPARPRTALRRGPEPSSYQVTGPRWRRREGAQEHGRRINRKAHTASGSEGQTGPRRLPRRILCLEHPGTVTLAVVAPAAAGVLHAAGLGEAVGGLVQQHPQHLQGAALEAFAADQDLMVAGAVDLPAPGGEVAQGQALGIAAGGDDHHRLRDVGVVGADGGPGAFERGD